MATHHHARECRVCRTLTWSEECLCPKCVEHQLDEEKKARIRAENPPNKKYTGDKDDSGDCRIVVAVQIKGLGPDFLAPAVPLHHVIASSPTGFNWGYGGAGPTDTAVSILCDHFGEKPEYPQGIVDLSACKGADLFQAFKRDFVAGWGAHWELTTEQIQAWINQHSPEAIEASLEFEVNGDS